MRRWFLAAAWAFGVTALLAQGPPAAGPVPPVVAPPAAAPAVDAVLWQHLVNWETVMKGAGNFYCKGKLCRETKTAQRKGKTFYTTDIMCQMPSKARMNVTTLPAPGAKADPDDFTAYIATGSLILEYEGLNKKVTETRLPPGSAKGMLLLDFMSGAITAKIAAERFAMRLDKEDANYVYVELRPKTPEDAGDFEMMTLVLFRNIAGQPAYLPRQVVIRRQNNQEEETWDFPKPAINVQGIKDSYFDPVPVDKKTWNYVIQTAPAARAAGNPRGAANPPGGLPAPAVVATPGVAPPK